MVQALKQACQLEVRFAETGDQPRPGVVYLAPPDYHLLVDEAGRLQLSRGPKVNYSRPAIDLLFSSAALFSGSGLLAVILTGANSDGVEGLRQVRARGGRVLVQDPLSAEADAMPKAAQAAVEVDYLIWLDQIGPFLWQLSR